MLGSILQGVGSIFTGFRANAAAKARARALEADAEEKKTEGALAAASITRDASRAIGRGVVAAASSGFTVSGSALDVLGDMAQEYDASSRNAVRNARFAALRLRNEARVSRYNGATALTEGIVRGAASFADGASDAAAAAAKAGG